MLNILSQYIYPISSFGIYPDCTKKDNNKLCQDSSSPNILIQDTSELRELGPPGSKNSKPSTGIIISVHILRISGLSKFNISGGESYDYLHILHPLSFLP